MGWLDSILGTSESNDPIRNLDPKLRDFLQKESPVKLEHEKHKISPVARPENSSHAPLSPAATSASTSASEDPAVPAASLFPDGRYAHLWKTYRPQHEIEEETKTSSERLMDVLEGFKERKAAIGQAALENCVLEQEEWLRCMRGGAEWSDVLQMCRTQVRRFERCYSMQSRFLRILGYMVEPGRSAEFEERIQMHADSFFHKMLAHEAAVEAARKEGRPLPGPFTFPGPSTLSSSSSLQPVDADSRLVSDDIRKKWQGKLNQLPEDERAAEAAALQADLRAKMQTAEKVEALWRREQEEREARKAAGTASVSDYVWSFLRPPPPAESLEGKKEGRA